MELANPLSRTLMAMVRIISHNILELKVENTSLIYFLQMQEPSQSLNSTRS
jgi:hypothetical protein